MLTITKLQAKIDGSFADIAVNSCDLSYCIKPTRQSWDFNEKHENPSFYVNLGIDTVKFSVDKATSGLVPQLVVGKELELNLCNAVEEIAGTFVINDVAIKNGFVVVSAMPKLGAAITEAKAA